MQLLSAHVLEQVLLPDRLRVLRGFLGVLGGIWGFLGVFGGFEGVVEGFWRF